MTAPPDEPRRPVTAHAVLATDVALVGAGHAHLHVIRHAARLHAAGLRVTVVAPRDFHYSGLLSPVATGLLPAEANRVDVAGLCAAAGVIHLDTEVTSADPHLRQLVCADGRTVRYRAVAYNLGSVSRTDHLDVEAARADGGQAGADPGPTRVLATKPVSSLLQLRTSLAAGERGLQIDLVGAGPTAVELAACITARRPDARVTLIAPDDAPLPGMPLPVRRRVVRVLHERGVRLAMGATVARVGPDGVEAHPVRGATVGSDATATSGGGPIHRQPAVAVLATGLVAPPVARDLGVGDARGIPVGPTLQHPDHPEVFATGDCSRFLPRALPALGVYGVRAAPVLLEGLVAWASGGHQPVFEPPHRSLQVLELGGGRGLAVRGRWWSHGRGALALKRAIDRRWLTRYR